MGACRDGATVCAGASQGGGRMGPCSMLVAEACAKACDQCAEMCEKHADDKKMKACAEECRKCAKACRDTAAAVSGK